jgi:PAS domain S-box-containing protein
MGGVLRELEVGTGSQKANNIEHRSKYSWDWLETTFAGRTANQVSPQPGPHPVKQRGHQKPDAVQSTYCLRAECQHYQRLFRFAPDGYLLTDLNGIIWDANEAASLLVERPICRLLGKSLADFIDEPECRRLPDQLARLKAEGQIRNWSVSLCFADQSPTYLQISISKIRDAHGETTGLAWLLHDVTELKALENHWKSYELIANCSKDFLTLIDTSYRYQAVNRAYCKAHNRSPDEILGKTVAQVWGEERFHSVIKQYLDICFNGHPVQHQNWFSFPNLGLRYFDVAYYPYFDHQSTVTHIVVVSRDITERKRVEDALHTAREKLELRVEQRTSALEQANIALKQEVDRRRHADERLQRGELRYTQLLETVTAYLYSVEVVAGRAVSTTHDPGCVAVTGYTPDDYRADPDLWYKMVYEPDQPTVAAHLAEMLAGEVTGSIEHRVRKKDGTIRWVRNSPVARYDDKCRLVAFDGLVTDITERKLAETALQASEAQYRALVDASPDIILTIDQSGYITSANATALACWGQADEILGKEIAGLFCGSDADIFGAQLLYVFETVQPVQFEQQLRLSPAEERWYFITLSPIPDPLAGKPAISVSLREITKCKQAEEALCKTKAMSKVLVDTSRQPVILLDIAGSVVAFNQAANRVTQLLSGHETLPGCAMQELLPPQLFAKFELIFDKALTGQSIKTKHQLALGDEPVWFEMELTPIAPDGGKVSLVYCQIENTVRDETAAVNFKIGETNFLAEMQSVQAAARLLVRELDINRLLNFVTSQARHLLNAEEAAIFLASDDASRLELAGPRAARPGLNQSTWLPANSLDANPVSNNGGATNGGHDGLAQMVCRLLRGQSVGDVLCVPLTVRHENLAVLAVWNAAERDFSEADRRLLSMFADQAALALQNARLHAKNHELAITQERHRLARDLHDSVTQSLYSIGLAAQALTRLINQSEFGRVSGPVEHIHALSQGALAEMRDHLHHLCSAEITNEGFVEAVKKYCDGINNRHNLVIDFYPRTDVPLVLEQQNALYLIAREALWNVVKHANATRLKIDLTGVDGQLVLKIEDDGVGFDVTDSASCEALGLKTMKDRAAQLGGTLQVDSEQGRGTCITVQIPS